MPNAEIESMNKVRGWLELPPGYTVEIYLSSATRDKVVKSLLFSFLQNIDITRKGVWFAFYVYLCEWGCVIEGVTPLRFIYPSATRDKVESSFSSWKRMLFVCVCVHFYVRFQIYSWGFGNTFL